MFVKKGNATTVSDVIQRNTKMNPDTFLRRSELPELENAKEAADVILEHIRRKQQITIVGDYDADGVTASAILYWAIMAAIQKEPGAPCNPPRTRIPRRYSEGYGLSEKIIDEIPPDSLLVTVDNGIAGIAAVQKAKEKNITVIVTDHHLPPTDEAGNRLLPPADIIVNPHVQSDCEFPDICGATVAYIVALAMFPDIKRFPSLLVLASIATVTDVMPLVGPNRTLLTDGLSLINQGGKNPPGLNALTEKLNLRNIDEDDYGFRIGPTINAAGRLYDNGGEAALKLLRAKKEDSRRFYWADTLVETNQERKRLVKECMAVAELAVSSFPIVLYEPSFSEGIIGIIAGQLSEKYNCPAIVFTTSEKDSKILKGSGRSSTVHLKNTLDSMQDCILKYGGHAGAAGISIEKNRLQEFSNRFRHAVGPLEKRNDETLGYDLELRYSEIPEVIREIKRFAPYGEGNPRPVFHMRCYTNGFFRKMGEGGSHFLIKGDALTLMGFNLTEKFESLGCPERIECVGYLKENVFRNQVEYVFEMIDFQPDYIDQT